MTTIVATDPVAAEADRLQAEFKEGSCFDAGTTGDIRIS